MSDGKHPSLEKVVSYLRPEGILNELMTTRKSSINVKGRINSMLKTWADISRINYISCPMNGGDTSLNICNSFVVTHDVNSNYLSEISNKYNDDEELDELFPLHITRLMNEEQLWGCYYIFPELFADEYSPVVRIQRTEDVPDLVDGVLTRAIVATCLTYLKRSPILGDYVFIKLDLSTRFLTNIEVLQHYKYLVYLDLSSNLLTDLHVLSYLLYLQFLDVGYNRLTTVLEYDTPQWFLSEVHYQFNSVKRIRDLDDFWSITILDLSHNIITSISGLESLKHLRRLDLSFNHIQRLEKLNHLRLLWLDLSYNNISSFEFGPDKGLWTLLDLQYLNLNDNNLTSMKLFSGCNRLREVHLRNNRLSLILEMAVYMRELRNLKVLDIQANPICFNVSFMKVVVSTFPSILRLNDKDLDPIEQRNIRMEDAQNVHMFVCRRLLRLLYVEQLRRAHVSPYVPAADSTDVPIVVFVGKEAVGKGTLVRRLAKECSANVERAMLHTTAFYHYPDHYIQVSRDKLDEMVLAGELLTFNDLSGECYGLSREQAFVKDGKVKIVSMELNAALLLSLRGFRPYLILTTYTDKFKLYQNQQERKHARHREILLQMSRATPAEKSTLQVLVSGRILVTGILHEILASIDSYSDESRDKFILDSECSLMMPSEIRQAKDQGKTLNQLDAASSESSSNSLNKESVYKQHSHEASICSIYKGSQEADNFTVSDVNTDQESCSFNTKKSSYAPEKRKESNVKNFDFSKYYASSTWKGLSSAKSSKTVTFNSQENMNANKTASEFDPSGMYLESRTAKDEKSNVIKSISKKWAKNHSDGSIDDIDLWLHFLMDNGLLRHSASAFISQSQLPHLESKEDADFIIKHLDAYKEDYYDAQKGTLRNDYETIHRKTPGKFYDTIEMDDPEAAFLKAKRILRDIVNSQKNLKPMFDIDFANMDKYKSVQKKLTSIRNQIAPQRLFY